LRGIGGWAGPQNGWPQKAQRSQKRSRALFVFLVFLVANPSAHSVPFVAKPGLSSASLRE
jgi:hypothetical protein